MHLHPCLLTFRHRYFLAFCKEMRFASVVFCVHYSIVFSSSTVCYICINLYLQFYFHLIFHSVKKCGLASVLFCVHYSTVFTSNTVCYICINFYLQFDFQVFFHSVKKCGLASVLLCVHYSSVH